MGSFLFRTIGHKATHRVLGKHARNGGFLDIKYGFSLFKDRHVPVTSKFLALSIGVAVTALLLALEAPLELLLGIFLPVIGEAADLVVDGLEVVFFPMVIACIVLPRLVRKPIYVQTPVIQTVPPSLGEKIDMPPPMLFDGKS